jgi:VanZ family protein
VSEIQPWRKHHPAHRLPDVARPNLSRFSIPDWLRSWWPALLWAAVIFTMSTDSFSAKHTGAVLEPILRWFDRSLTEEQFKFLHHLIRKSAHFTEYFVFCLFLYRGVRGARAGWRWAWGFEALFIAAAYSVLDEVHQAFVASRTASPYDSLLDSAGAFAAFAFLFLWFRLKKTRMGDR